MLLFLFKVFHSCTYLHIVTHKGQHVLEIYACYITNHIFFNKPMKGFREICCVPIHFDIYNLYDIYVFVLISYIQLILPQSAEWKKI